jgi:hypothetical protein
MLYEIETDISPFKGIKLTFDFTDCTVETLIPFVAKHLATRYGQTEMRKAIADAEKSGDAVAIPATLLAEIKVADIAKATPHEGRPVTNKQKREIVRGLKKLGLPIPAELQAYA